MYGGGRLPKLADAVEKGKVEKGKNELILFFTCAPVETGISYSDVSQRAYRKLPVGNRTDRVSPYIIFVLPHRRLKECPLPHF